ncbi:MAG: hypothetical protein JO115_25510 [Pseudonocardiales bacterium]|nr:hypothetical protein [Pseudonocardiales bacterium]
MPDPGEVARLREQAVLTSSDAAAARGDDAGTQVPAVGADRDVSEVRAKWSALQVRRGFVGIPGHPAKRHTHNQRGAPHDPSQRY